MRIRPFDPNGAFTPVTLGGMGELRQLAVEGAGSTLLSGAAALGIQIVGTIVLARLLTPKDFGLVTMVTTFSLLLVSFGENGLPEAVVQREKIDCALASTLFWINVAAGLLLTIAFAGAGSLLARLYNDISVEHVTVGVSLTIFVTSTSVLHLALLKRAMRFRVVSVNGISARLVYVVVSISLARAGWGYWALVAGSITMALSQSVGAWFLCKWIPGLPRRVPGTGSTLRFALNTYGRFGIGYCTGNTDNLLVGWRFGSQLLGYYKKAYDLFALSAGQITHSLTLVFVSALSRVNRNSVEFRRYVLGTLSMLALIGMGLSAELTLVGKDLIRLLLGPGWEPAGKIFTFFGPGIGVMILYHTHGWVHLSIGRADRWLRWGIIEFAVTCILFLIGLPWGPIGIATAWTVSFWLLIIPAMAYAGNPVRLKVGAMIEVVWKYILASLLAGCVTFFTLRHIPYLVGLPGALGAVIRIATTSLLVAIFYPCCVVMLHRGFDPLYQIGALLREAMPSSRLSRWVVITSRPVAEVEFACAESQATSKASGNCRVSILIPAYNAGKSIEETIRSALAQTWEPKEIIVVDDRSVDRTLEIATKFASESVRVVTQQNEGASSARNKAFSISRGDYIQWLDADDLLSPDKIARQMEIADSLGNKRILLSSSWGQFWYRTHRAKFIPSSLWCDLSPAEFLLRKMRDNVFMQTSTWLVSRELTEAAGPWDTSLSADDDGEYFCRVLLKSDGIRFVPESTVYYRYSGTAGLAYIGRSRAKLNSLWRSMHLHMTYLRSLEDSERVHSACCKYMQTNLIYFYPECLDVIEQQRQVANCLGGSLEIPCLSRKFSWIKYLLGWRLAAHAQLLLPHLKWSWYGLCDKVLLRLENINLKKLALRPETPAPVLQSEASTK